MKKTTLALMATTFLLFALVAVFIVPTGIAPNNVSMNYKNVTVHTNLSITHSRPEVLNVTLFEATNVSLKNITVAAGLTKTVSCNASIRDWDGFNDVIHVNATLWHVLTSTSNGSDNNNSHYTNYSCTFNNSISAYVGYFICNFDVWYYANNGTWMCNVTPMNSWNYTNSGNGSTLFYPVYALNVTDGIDYGGVAVYTTSPERIANVTNLGNMGINITVEGYGAIRGDGLAMNCSINGNITVDNERFSIGTGVAWAAKTPLVSTPGGVPLSGLTLPKQTVPATYVVNSTYWEIYIPPNPAGNCTGNIIFTAIAP